MTPFPGTPIHDMAVRGESGYKLLARGWSDYDKYSTGVLELDDVPLYMLKYYQIQCYLSLYVRNGRILELLVLAWNHRRMATEMIFGLLTSCAARLGLRSGGARTRAERVSVK